MRPNELVRLTLDAGGGGVGGGDQVGGGDEVGAGDGGGGVGIRYYREGLSTDPDGRTAALAQLVLEKSNSTD